MSAATLEAKIDDLDRKLDKVEEIDEHLEKLVGREEANIKEIEDKEQKIEKSLVKFGAFEVKRSQLMELIRGMAGAFLGVGLGQAVGGSINTAQTLPWINVIGILFFIIVFVGLIIYRKDKAEIEGQKRSILWHIARELSALYFIAIMVQLLGLILFNNYPGFNETLVKALIIGSYTAMSSAVAFTLI